MHEFKPFQKIPRLNRDVVITEKIDGTNASVLIAPWDETALDKWSDQEGNTLGIWAGSRTRWVVPSNDNHGFASWVKANLESLKELGPGHHFGEFWGSGIQRGYNQIKKRFSLFNTAKWADSRPACCDVVPKLWEGPFDTARANQTLEFLKEYGSHAALGYPYPEGIVVYHTAGNHLYKKTIESDEVPKALAPKGPRTKSDRRKTDVGWIHERRAQKVYGLRADKFKDEY